MPACIVLVSSLHPFTAHPPAGQCAAGARHAARVRGGAQRVSREKGAWVPGWVCGAGMLKERHLEEVRAAAAGSALLALNCSSALTNALPLPFHGPSPTRSARAGMFQVGTRAWGCCMLRTAAAAPGSRSRPTACLPLLHLTAAGPLPEALHNLPNHPSYPSNPP